MPKRKATQTPAKSGEKSTASTPPTRSSKRVKLTPSTGESVQKSKYFETSDAEDEVISEPEDEKEVESGYEDNDAVSEESESAEEESSDSEADRKRVKRRTPAKKGRDPPAEFDTYENKELWREGVKTGLGPGKAVFIAKPKAKGDGGIKYVPDKIHPNTLDFLGDLKKNNDRMWLKAHDPDYRTSWKDFESFVEVLSEKIAEIDETVPELPPKDLVFRIYRDVRFSKDPTPYKTNFSAAFSRTGRKGPYACYYVSLQPGDKSFVGCGLWHPDAAPLALLRNDIDHNPGNIRNVLNEAQLRKELLNCTSKDVKKAVQAFCKKNAENALKTKPKVRTIFFGTQLADFLAGLRCGPS